MDTDASLAPLEDACTVVLLRDGNDGLETLMLERPGNSRSFGGAWVFPGGKVDPQDRMDGAGNGLDELASAQVAGLRELAEETGQQLQVDQLVWFAKWTPMQALPRRFRTWFMMAPATNDPILLNPAEHERYEWLRPADALARHAEAQLMLVPPTWVTLHHLVAMKTATQALEQARNAEPFAYQTHLLQPDSNAGPVGLLWSGDEAYPQAPGRHSTAGQPGARHRLNLTGMPWIYERSGF